MTLPTPVYHSKIGAFGIPNTTVTYNVSTASPYIFSKGALSAAPALTLVSPKSHCLSTIIGITFTLIGLAAIVVYIKTFAAIVLLFPLGAGIGGCCNMWCRHGDRYKRAHKIIQIITGITSFGMALFAVCRMALISTDS